MAPHLCTMSSGFEDAPPPTRATRRSSMPLFGMSIAENKTEVRRFSNDESGLCIQGNGTSDVGSSPEDFDMSQEELNQKMQMLMKNPSLWNEFKQRLAQSDHNHRSGVGLKVLLREFLKENVELQEKEAQQHRPVRRMSLFQGFGQKEAPPPPEPAQPVSHQQEVIESMLLSQSNHARNRSSHSRMDNSSHHHRRISMTGSSQHRRPSVAGNDSLSYSSHHRRTTGIYQSTQDPSVSQESAGKRMLRRATGAFITEPANEVQEITQDLNYNLRIHHDEDENDSQKEDHTDRKRFSEDTEYDEHGNNKSDEESEYGDEPINEEDLQFGFRR